MHVRILFIVAALLPLAAAFLPTPQGLGRVQRLPSAHAATSPRSAPLQLRATLDAIFFDCDGVLADTERDGHRIAFNMAFKEFGLKVGDNDMEWGEELYGKLCEIGGGKERMMGYWQQIGWPGGDWDLAVDLHKRKTQLFQELVDTGKIPLRPGVDKLITEALDNNVRVAVCSTSNEKAVQKIVDLLGPEKSSQIKIFAGDCVPRKKPSPDIYNLAREDYQVRPEDVVVIEDSGIGLAAAKAAEMSCVVTMSTYTRNDDFSEADHIVDDLVSGDVDLTTIEGLATSTQWEDWGVDRDIMNSGVGRGRW